MLYKSILRQRSLGPPIMKANSPDRRLIQASCSRHGRWRSGFNRLIAFKCPCLKCPGAGTPRPWERLSLFSQCRAEWKERWTARAPLHISSPIIGINSTKGAIVLRINYSEENVWILPYIGRLATSWSHQKIVSLHRRIVQHTRAFFCYSRVEED